MFGTQFKDKKVLVTGHTGFKGSWLSLWLRELGATVIGYGLDPLTSQDNFVLTGLEEKIIDIRGDIRDYKHLKSVFETYKPEIVFHLAAQSLVRKSYEEPVHTYETNVMGTINILESVRYVDSVKAAILVTTDKCYANQEQIWGYKENDPLGGYDPYSSSKAAAEIAIDSWRNSFFNNEHEKKQTKAIASVRAGNVIGGGDWAKDRIIPDCIRAFEGQRPLEMRNPQAIRPWQHVLEPLSGYLTLALKMLEDPYKYSEAWNFGPNYEAIIKVGEVVSLLQKEYGEGQIIDVSSQKHLHEAQLLNLDISKSVFKLGWKPVWSLEEAIHYTVQWYKRYKNEDVYKLCKEQIERYEKD